MKRGNLCKTKKLVAIILAASIATCLNATAFADTVKVDATNQDVNETVNTDAKAGNNDTAAVEVKSDNGNEADLTLNASAEADATNRTEESTGVMASSEKSGSSTEVTVNGDVSTDTKSGSATGVSAVSKNGGSTDVTINGNTDAKSEATGKEAIGIDAYGKGTSNTKVTAEGNVSAEAKDKARGARVTAKDNAKVELDVNNGGISAKSEDSAAFGVHAGATGSNASSKTSVDKDVTATSSGKAARGVHINEVNNGGTVDISISGDVNAKSKTIAEAINLGEMPEDPNIVDGTVNIQVGGSVESNSEDTAYGIFGSTGKGNVNINVGGDVNAKSDNKATTIDLYSADGNVDINVSGNVNQEGSRGKAISLFDGTENADISVNVAKDVTASTTAVTITKKEDKSSIDLLVSGTITGKEHNIVLSDQSSTENLNITVWKVDTSNDKKVVETDTGSALVQNEEAEKKINYIIKVDPVSTSGGALGVSGTIQSHGYDTAHEGDKVYLQVTVPSGYEFDVNSFYNVSGSADCKVIESNGNYYLEVPKGGGVFVGVNLRKKDTTPTGGGDNDGGGNDGGGDTVNPNNKSTSGYPNEETVMAMPIQVPTLAGTPVTVKVSDILTLIGKPDIINSFTASDLGTIGIDNIMGAGIVSFHNMFLYSASDTVNVPVPANVIANQSYTVMFSDGTSVPAICAENGILIIPFNKAAEGLTYIIYGLQMNPLMFIGM